MVERGHTAALVLEYESLKTVVAIFLFAIASARAIILFDTDDPTANTSAPGDSLANSGWQYEGLWGGFLGTPIAPHFFLSAAHIGNAGGGTFTFQNVNYSVVDGFYDPVSDLVIWQVNETFPTFAPLYTKQEEVGQLLVAIGRGTQRGAARLLNGQLRGWDWGANDNTQRWGENVVSSIYNNGIGFDLLRPTFDQNGVPNECTFSTGDSGGAVFIEDGAAWKLAGINYAVDDPFYTAPDNTKQFYAALFDMSGFYESDDGGVTFDQISGTPPIPQGLYPTRISTKLPWIYSIIDPSGDWDGDGVPNLLEYALFINTPPSSGYGAIQASATSGAMSIIYRKISDATNLQYQVEQSTDLVRWQPITPQEQVIETHGNLQTIKASVPIGDNPRLFLRVRITQF